MPRNIKKRTTKSSIKEERATNLFHRVQAFVFREEKVIVPVVVAVVVLLVLSSGFFIYQSSTNKKAEALAYDAYKTYYTLYQAQPAERAALYRNALEKFKKAYETRKSPFALFYMSNCYFGMGRYDEALKALAELNEKFPDDEGFVPLSYYKMAVITLNKGDKEAALKLLDTLYNYKSASLKDLALIESARILESMGKAEESAKKYEEITKSFPNSPFGEEAKSKISARKG